jgi:hypothetical protein
VRTAHECVLGSFIEFGFGVEFAELGEHEERIEARRPAGKEVDRQRMASASSARLLEYHEWRAKMLMLSIEPRCGKASRRLHRRLSK